MEYIYNITLHLIPSGEIPVVTVKQGDASTRFIKATVVQGDQTYIPGAEQTVMFREEKPDGTGVLMDNNSIDTELGRSLVTVDEDGVITIELIEQTSTCPGYCRCDLCFVSGGELISTAPFLIEVARSPGISGSAVSGDDFRSLVNALDRVWESGVIAVPGVVASGTVVIGTGWTGDDPYTCAITQISGYTPTEHTVVSIVNDADVMQQLQADGVTNLFITNTGGTLTAHAIGGRPSVQLTVPVIFIESDTATYHNVQDGQVIAYDNTAGTWVNKDIGDYGFLTEQGVRTIVTSYGYQTATQVNNLIRDYIQAMDGNDTEY